MRKMLTQLLIVFMSMPYLACAMPACGHETAIIQSEVQPCVSHNKVAEHGGYEAADITFLQDCMGVDVQLIQYDSSLQKADYKVTDTVISAHGAGLFEAQALFETSVRSLWDIRAHPSPNIILTTQRFRL